MRSTIYLFTLLTLSNFPVPVKAQSDLFGTPVIKECLDKEDPAECTTWKISNYLRMHFKYPAIARENGLEGTILLGLTIGKGGKLDSIEILRLPGKVFRKNVEKINTKIPTAFSWQPAQNQQSKGGSIVKDNCSYICYFEYKRLAQIERL